MILCLCILGTVGAQTTLTNTRHNLSDKCTNENDICSTQDVAD